MCMNKGAEGQGGQMIPPEAMKMAQSEGAVPPALAQMADAQKNAKTASQNIKDRKPAKGK